jgi:hypothetical protein
MHSILTALCVPATPGSVDGGMQARRARKPFAVAMPEGQPASYGPTMRILRGTSLTREHVIPRWLSNVLPEQARYRGQDQASVLLHLDGTVNGPHHREMVETFNSPRPRLAVPPRPGRRPDTRW